MPFLVLDFLKAFTGIIIYHIISDSIVFYYMISYSTISYNIKLRYILLCYIVLYLIILYYRPGNRRGMGFSSGFHARSAAAVSAGCLAFKKLSAPVEPRLQQTQLKFGQCFPFAACYRL